MKVLFESIGHWLYGLHLIIFSLRQRRNHEGSERLAKCRILQTVTKNLNLLFKGVQPNAEKNIRDVFITIVTRTSMSMEEM